MATSDPRSVRISFELRRHQYEKRDEVTKEYGYDIEYHSVTAHEIANMI